MILKLHYGPHLVGVVQGFVEGGEHSMVPTVLCGPHLVEVMQGFVEGGEHTV